MSLLFFFLGFSLYFIPGLGCHVRSFDRIYLVSVSSSYMNKLFIMFALRSLVILTIRVTYLFSTCLLKLLDCQASIASEENVIVILLFGVFLYILSPVLHCCVCSFVHCCAFSSTSYINC